MADSIFDKKGYSCFFITPIGSDDSLERRNSDYVLRTILRPALLEHGFSKERIVRSDRGHGPDISQDMINHLKNDDLCIADITGHPHPNPNVMYEYGYRIGLGKPVIAIVQEAEPDEEGTKIPFDVDKVRLIKYPGYDASQAIRDRLFDTAVDELEDQIAYWVAEGFVASSGTASVTDINNRLNSIEGKLDRVLAGTNVSSGGASVSNGNSSLNEIIRQIGSPVGAFNYALRNRDATLAEALLPRLKATRSKENYIDKAVAQVAAMGSQKAAQILKAEWQYITDNLTLKQRYEELAAYVSYCNRQDVEPEEIDFVLTEAQKLLEIPGTDNSFKAGVYNQINRISYGVYTTQRSRGEIPDEKYLDQAIAATQKATELNPQEESYFYNMAMCYQTKKAWANALNAIESCLALDRRDADHLSLAYQIYRRNHLPEKAREVLEELRAISPYRAEMMETESDDDDD